MQDILKIVSLILGISAMTCGAYKDIKERRYPKPFFFTSVVAGLCYAWFSGFFIQALIAFVAFTFLGVWSSDKKLMANGDLWCLSTLFLYINVVKPKQCILLIAFIFLWTFIVGTYYHRNVLSDLKNGLTKVIALIGYKIYFTIDVNQAKKKESIPVTVILVGALITTLISIGVIGW